MHGSTGRLKAVHRWLAGKCLTLVLFARGVACAPDASPEPPSLALALSGLPQGSQLTATLHTSAGVITCALAPETAPRAVALFVGLSRGRAAWRDPRTGRVQRRPLYRDLRFFRAIPGGLLQGGCPLNNGTGHPGYRLPVEVGSEDAARLMRPGALLLARYQPAPNRDDPAAPPPGHVIGSQFVITLTDMHHLAGEVSVIGACAELAVARRLAQRVADGQRADLLRVSILSRSISPRAAR